MKWIDFRRKFEKTETQQQQQRKYYGGQQLQGRNNSGRRWLEGSNRGNGINRGRGLGTYLP